MKKIFFLFIVFFIRTNSEIKENPIFLVDTKNPFVLSTNNDYYYAITAGKSLKIDKESGKIENITINSFTNLNYIYIVDNSYNNYIYYSNKYYLIIFEPFISYKEIEIYSELISEEQNQIKILGSIAKDNDFIFYGKEIKDSFLFFSSKTRYYCFSQEIKIINDQISCKFIENENYICAMIIYPDNSKQDSLTLNIQYELSNNIVSFSLYDTGETNIKLLCEVEAQNTNITCKFFKINDSEGFAYLGDSNIVFQVTNNKNFNEKNCSLSQFNNEYLFCCAIINFIKCFRINSNTHYIIKQFQLPKIIGYNSHLTIKSNKDYSTFFFMNAYYNRIIVYEYYIYLPVCQDKKYFILNSLNENKPEENWEKLRNLFTIKTNKYFFELENQASEVGYFTLNNERINQKILINNNDFIIDFIVTNNNISSYFTKIVNYKVSVEEEEAYSKECHITLIFQACYHSCEKCSKDINNSNIENHNCIECKNNYYSSPENNSNCFSMEEKKINWYFDSIQSKFGVCHEECRSCNGPTKFNCLSCYNGLYLDNNTCTSSCSQGYFPIRTEINSDYYFICQECYHNCKSCLNIGDAEKMNCATCKDNKIKYKDNCYDINNPSIKSFYEPKNNGFYITNCYEKFGLFIKENSNECIPLPIEEEGYYISNKVTDLLSKCHDNCLSCNNGPIKYDSGIIQSMECIKCKDSNSSSNTMIKMNNNCFKIVEYTQEKIIFNVSEIRPDNHLATCMDFGKVIYYGEYECIEKPNNTYYVLNDNNENINSITIINEDIYKNMSLFTEGDGEDRELSTIYLKIDKNTNFIEFTKDYEVTEKLNNNYTRNEPISSNDGDTFGKLDKEKDINKLKSLILSNITSYVSSYKIFNMSNFIVSVVSSNKIDPEEQIKKGISAYDLGNCTNIIKEYYNISNEENLVIFSLETKKDKNQKDENYGSFKLGKNTKLEIYDYSGKKLNLSVCRDDIKIMKYIGDVEELDINTAMSFSSQGIDIFNAADDFFNDICHPYDNPEGKDIILSDRRNDIYQNITFCEYGCTYSGINYKYKFANCICKSNIFQEEEQNIIEMNENIEFSNFKDLSKVFLENLFSFNFEVLRCYNLVLNTKILVHNIGFYCLLSMFALQIIFVFIYLLKRLTSLKSFMLKFENKNNNNSSKNNINIINQKRYKNIYNKGNSFIPLFQKKIKTKIKSYNNSNNDNKKQGYKFKKNNDYILEPNKKKKNKMKNIPEDLDKNEETFMKLNLKSMSKIESKKNLSISNNLENNIKIHNLYNKNYFVNKNKLNQFNKHIKNNREKNKSFLNINNNNIIGNNKSNNQKKNQYLEQDSNKLFQIIYDLQEMSYEEAIIYDNRGYLKIYFGFLVDSQIILGAFCSDNHLDLFVIKLSFLVCTFQISFFLNAFFFTDEYISDAYHNDGVLDFFSGLPKSIYSFIATLITTNLLRMLSNSKSELMRLIKEKRKYRYYIYLIHLKLAKLRKKLVVYFILIFIFSIFFLYYVTAFCAVYRNSQKYWFYGCLESVGIDSLVAFGICIFLAFCRYISVKKKIKCFYIVANIISTFL